MNSEQRLEQIFRENENKGMAVAITGSWGVGKTFFWNTFRKNNPNKKKYVYVSLFGLESLSDLKTHIYSHIENNSSAIEIPRWIRGLPSILKETKISQFGISSSAKIFDSLMFNQVKDAIICFDDFERMSNKLDIKDVMGLANQLKLERNCQVILILDESKTENENKKKYVEYKEKLIDEEIKITSVEPLIRASTQGIDAPLIDLMVEFAEKLEIHNFRFFQKVIKLYGKFIEQLPKEVAYSTKEIILIRVLQGYFIEDFGKEYEFGWDDIKLVFEEKQKDLSKRRQKTYESLKLIAYDFVYADEWLIEFKKYFDQIQEPDFIRLAELANSHLISEYNNNVRSELERLMMQWRNLEINSQFCQKLYDASCKRIGFENLENLNFYCELLVEFGDESLACELEEKIKGWLQERYISTGHSFVEDQFSFGFKSENKFHIYLKKLNDEMPYQGLPSLIEIIYQYVGHSGWNPHTDPQVLRFATKADWKDLIFNGISKDERFKEFHKLGVLRKILNQQMNVELQPQINALIFEVLDDEAKVSNPVRQKNIEYVIKRLKE
ncbi:P-loop NTPase fold protein [Acinetobacter indicus]|uniref:P-loop NTPase fold protein n=1 Tax=Acinetobacter indicus TaxID=756892 RepID=UPI0032B339DF